MFFIVFLSLFSYVILENYHPLNVDHDQKISITELMLHICILGLLIDEIYQVNCLFFVVFFSISFRCSILFKIENIIIIFKINGIQSIGQAFLFIRLHLQLVSRRINLFLFVQSKISLKNGVLFVEVANRILMSIDLIIWYTRVLYLFTAHKVLGPKLVMIYAMVNLSLIGSFHNVNCYLYRRKMLF